MARRGCCLGGCIGLLALCVVGSGLGYVVALPLARTAVRHGISDGIATQVVGGAIAAGGAAAAPGTYTLSAAAMQQELRGVAVGNGVNDVTVRIMPDQFEVGLDTASGGGSYTGRLAAVDGWLVVENMAVSGQTLGWLFPADTMAAAIAAGVNNYLAANNLRLIALDQGNGTLTLTTERAVS